MRDLLKSLLVVTMIAVAAPASAMTLYAFNDFQLAVAISQASGGDTIKLGPGNYNGVLIRGDAFNQVNVGGNIILGGAPTLSSNVTIESLDPLNRAVVNNIDVRVSNYWTFSGLDILPAPAGSSYTAVKFSGDNNRLQNSLISYGDASGWSAADWLNNAGRGVSVVGANNTVYNNYLKNVGGGMIFGHGSTGGQAVQNTINGIAGDAVQAHGHHTLLEKNLFKNFKDVSGNHDDCIQSFSRQGGVIGAGSVVGLTIRSNMCIANEDPNDPFYSGTQGYVIFNGLAEDWVIENNIMLSSTYHGIFLTDAENTLIVNNTVLDDDASINGANTAWVRINGSGAGNEIRDNIANKIINNPNVVMSGNAQINIPDYDDWFVDWLNYDFTLKDDAPIPGIGAMPMNPGALFDPYAPIPLPGGFLLLFSSLLFGAGWAWRRGR